MSPLLHQTWFLIRGINDNFVEHVGVMFIGDLVGTLIIIYLAKLIIRLLKKTPSKPH
jgi:predicted tellurium resistance membrane protein TerC